MRILAAVLLLATGATSASAQAINPEFVWNRDYAFERLEATRQVNDRHDKGTIRLVAFVYRPLKNDRKEAVIFSHGSTAGLARSPKEQGDAPPPAVIRFFVSRGYTLVAPMRRGRGESTGTYVEECSVYVGECTVEEQDAGAERALREALADTNAVIEQLILGRLVPRDSKVIAAGISRGGHLSLVLSGERPSLVKGVVNFVGGWLGVTERVPAPVVQNRMAFHAAAYGRAARQASAPAIWIYGARDPFYLEGAPRQWFDGWQAAGGRGEFVFISEHTLPNGHQVATQLPLWEKQLDAFLRRLER